MDEPEAKRGRGRPPGRAVDEHLHIRAPAAELQDWRERAERAGRPLAAWVRDKLNAPEPDPDDYD